MVLNIHHPKFKKFLQRGLTRLYKQEKKFDITEMAGIWYIKTLVITGAREKTKYVITLYG